MKEDMERINNLWINSLLLLATAMSALALFIVLTAAFLALLSPIIILVMIAVDKLT